MFWKCFAIATLGTVSAIGLFVFGASGGTVFSVSFVTVIAISVVLIVNAGQKSG